MFQWASRHDRLYKDNRGLEDKKMYSISHIYPVRWYALQYSDIWRCSKRIFYDWRRICHYNCMFYIMVL